MKTFVLEIFFYVIELSIELKTNFDGLNLFTIVNKSWYFCQIVNKCKQNWNICFGNIFLCNVIELSTEL